MNQQPIYKIVTEGEWQAARSAGLFKGAAVDLADGFIHFSTADQVEETAARHFAGQTDLLLVAVDPAALGDALKYELSRGGALFPHLYGDLSFDAVLWEKPLPVDGNGRHDFAGLLS
ncbi:DUF952 domain-containing protein [Martelella mediterranea]|uniref:DUF952 domain-containing protein n=1 Tax=Martelella mediterranea TaxID=293089 RepID=UPI001E3223D5|nr:DUF952 domain-containing protein [Martelella mediterranea]MCD1634418.1 DUF952 domain-containing protein [Martelella mediterranea]